MNSRGNAQPHFCARLPPMFARLDVVVSQPVAESAVSAQASTSRRGTKLSAFASEAGAMSIWTILFCMWHVPVAAATCRTCLLALGEELPPVELTAGKSFYREIAGGTCNDEFCVRRPPALVHGQPSSAAQTRVCDV